MFALERSGWLLVLDTACPAAKINSHQDTTSKQNVIFHERLLSLLGIVIFFIALTRRKDDKSKLVAKNEAFKYLQVCTIESIEQDEELLVKSTASVESNQHPRLRTGPRSGLVMLGMVFPATAHP